LRSAARPAGALLGFYGIVAAGAKALDFALPRSLWGHGWPAVIAPAAVQVIGGALAANLLWAVAGWRSWRAQGWPGTRQGVRGFGLGLLLGLGMAACAVVLGVIAGGARVSLSEVPSRVYWGTAAALLGSLALAALSEEMLFRGFPLARLSDAMGPVAASTVLAVAFAALHFPNPGVTPLGLVNVALASLALSTVFFRLGGVPAAWGAHFGWNAGLGVAVDAPVSGISFHVPGVSYSAEGPDWIAGGGFGPEGGLVATVVMGAVTVWLGRGVVRSRSETDKTDEVGEGRRKVSG